jgi:hypothetical protein
MSVLTRNDLCQYTADMPQLGPYSRTAILSKLDGRTREARLMRGTRAALIAHVGGKPSVVGTNAHTPRTECFQSAAAPTRGGLTPMTTVGSVVTEGLGETPQRRTRPLTLDIASGGLPRVGSPLTHHR